MGIERLYRALRIFAATGIGVTGSAGAISQANAESPLSPTEIVRPGISSSDIISTQLTNNPGISQENIQKITNKSFPQKNTIESFQDNGLLLFYETKVPQIKREVQQGRIYWGDPTPELQSAMDREKERLANLGISESYYLGLPKGVYYLENEGKYYPFITWERGVYHPVTVDGNIKLMRTLTVSDFAKKVIQLDYDGKTNLPLSENEKSILSQMPVTGEFGSNVPSIPTMVEKNLLTLTGNENYAADKTGQAITERIDKSGNITNDQSGEYKYGAYINGHNLPDVVLNFFNAKFGSLWEAINVYGLPVSETYKIRAFVNGAETEQYVLLTERGMVTITPSNPEEYIVQGGLLGNRFQETIDPAICKDIPQEGEFKGTGWRVFNEPDLLFSYLLPMRLL